MRHFDWDAIELADHFHGGHLACPGCGVAQGLKFVLGALDPGTVAVYLPSCVGIIANAGGANPQRFRHVQAPFAGAAAAAAGVARALRLRGEPDRTVCVLAGDGGTYDIGLQGISGAGERGEDILYICLDNEGYMNTGAQRSSASPLHAVTGSTPAGKPTPKKDMAEIMAAHRAPYVATATVAFPDDLQRKIRKAKGIRGFRFLTVLASCLPGWGLADHLSTRASRLAVETNYFPLYEVEDGCRYAINRRPRGLPVQRFLELQGRFRHLDAVAVAEIQAAVDRRWAQLCERAGSRPCHS